MKGAKLIELARALQREIRSTPEAGFTDEQNGEIADMETALQKFIETVEGKCAAVSAVAQASGEAKAA